MEKQLFTDTIENAVNERAILLEKCYNSYKENLNYRTPDLSFDSISFYSKSYWSISESSDLLNIKDLRLNSNKIQNNISFSNINLNKATANDTVNSLEITIQEQIADCTRTAYYNKADYQECNTVVSPNTLQCSPQSRLHNWLDAKDLYGESIDQNQNAIVQTEEALQETNFYDNSDLCEANIKFYTNLFDPSLTFRGLTDWYQRGCRNFPDNIPSTFNPWGDVQVTLYDKQLKEYNRYIRYLFDSSRLYNGQYSYDVSKIIQRDIIQSDEKLLEQRICSPAIKSLWCDKPKQELICQAPAHAKDSVTYCRLNPVTTSTLQPRSKLDNCKIDSDQTKLTKSSLCYKQKRSCNLNTEIVSNTVLTDKAPPEKSLLWWSEANATSLNSISTAGNLHQIENDVDKSMTCNLIFPRNTRKNDQEDWLKELMMVSGLTNIIDFSKTCQEDASHKSGNTSIGEILYGSSIWEGRSIYDACSLFSEAKSSAISSSVSDTPATVSLKSTAPQDTSWPKLDSNIQHGRQSVVTATTSQKQSYASSTSIKGNLNELNIRQLFQAAQAGCQTVISRGRIPCTYFYNQRPTFVQPNAQIIWQPYLTHCSLASISSSAPLYSRISSVPITDTAQILKYSLPKSDVTVTTLANISHDSKTLASQVRQQIPFATITSEDNRKMGNDCIQESTVSNFGLLNRNSTFCIPVALNIRRPNTNHIAAALNPACYTAQPTIQIALNNYQKTPTFTSPFQAVYRANCSGVKNLNTNNSVVTSGSEEEMDETDDKHIIMHGCVPEFRAPTIQPSLTSLQANVIQIFPTKIVYS